MSQKVLLVFVDGMRPDSLEMARHPFIEEMKAKGSFTLQGRTVMPSVTLPCHMSLFHSVPPQRHGIVDNVYTPQVRPIKGLFEQLRDHKKNSAIFYNWEQLRDLGRPGSIAHSCFFSDFAYTYEESDRMLTDRVIEHVQGHQPDFLFLYLGWVDEAGHKYGWMSDKYIQAVYHSWLCIEKVARALPEDYTLIVTSDHGGHDRCHGTEMPEDMTIPLFIKGKGVAPGGHIPDARIIDIAPTIAHILGVPSNEEWEGKCLL